jgi:hypothetical protein
MSTTQKSLGEVDWEVFTLDGLFVPTELLELRAYVERALKEGHPFTPSPFANGKRADPALAADIYRRMRPFLPAVFTDRAGATWRFVGAPDHVMYAEMRPGQQFGLHTDTGCEHDVARNRFSKHTVLVYLNDDFEGGCTAFYDDAFAPLARVRPKEGRVLAFDIDRFHAGEPVLAGTKRWIGTELVAERLPMRVA